MMETNNLLRFLAILTIFVLVRNVHGTIAHDFNKVVLLETVDEVENMKSTRNVAVIYYYKRDFARLLHFFKEFDKSAEYLAVYGVQAGIVNCSKKHGNLPIRCTETLTEHAIYTYKDGEELLILDLETMFDVNSIMSNILQLVLLREVPIIQNEKDKVELVERSKGKTDIIVSYQKAIGTYEHRIFMEVAFAYQDKYAFAVTTDREAISKLNEGDTLTETSLAAIWVLHCKEIMPKEDCVDVRYKGKLDLPSLAKFLRALSLPRYVTMKTGDEIQPYLKENLEVVYLVYDIECQHLVMETAEKYKYDFHGMIGIVLVNKDVRNDALREIIAHVNVPGIGVLLTDEPDPIFMTSDWSEKAVSDFIKETLLNKKGDNQNEQTGPPVHTEVVDMKPANKAKYDDLPTIEAVEEQDDPVAEYVYRMSKTPMTLDRVAALTDQTFTTTVKNTDLLMVMFYLPFDARNMAFLRSYGEAAELLTNNKSSLARINCYDWTDVCGNQNISMYPTIKLFKNGRYLEDYNGILARDAVVRTINLLEVGSPINLHVPEIVTEFITGKYPENLTTMTNTSVLAVFDNHHKQERIAFKTVVRGYRKSIVFGITNSNIAKSIVKVKAPAIIIIRHDDPYKSDDGLTSEFTVDNIIHFIETKKIPVLPELTAFAFPEFYKQDKPLLVLFLDDTVSVYTKETLATMSKSGQFSQFLFCWMDVRSNRRIGEKILKEYTQSKEIHVPALTIVNNRKGDVYNFPSEEFTETTISNWLNDITSKTLEPSKVLPAGHWKPPGKSYDFLKMIDFENEHGKAPSLSKDGSDYEEDGENKRSDESDIEDMEARADLIGLGNSRLYHMAKDRDMKFDKLNKNINTQTHQKDEL